MTLKQLLDSLSFDEIAPYIFSRYKNCDVTGLLAPYKQHFDYLHSLVPTAPQLLERKEARISLYEEGENTYLDAFPLEGDRWEDSLSKELVIDKDIQATDAEIAACCLWHLSYYGYLPYQREETFDNLFDGIEKRRTLTYSYKKKYSEFIPSKREMSRMPSFHNEVKNEIQFWRRHRRTKQDKREHTYLSFKKRCWRRRKRETINREYDKRITYCSSFIDGIIESGCGIDKKRTVRELSVLYHSSHVSIKRLDSFAFNATKRFAYLKELIEKYGAMDGISRYSNIFVCLSASSAHPITEEEKKMIDILTKGLSGRHQLYIKTDDSCGVEMRIDVAFYEY